MGGANWMKDYIANKNRRAKTQVNTQPVTESNGAMPGWTGSTPMRVGVHRGVYLPSKPKQSSGPGQKTQPMTGLTYEDANGNIAYLPQNLPDNTPKNLSGKEILPGGVMPKYNGPAWQLPAYGVKTPQDYRDKILSGSAFGAKRTGASQAPNTLPVMIEDQYGNLTYAKQNTPSPVSATTAQRIAWGNAVDYEDASDRSARRARELPASGKGLFDDVGDAIGRSMSNVIPWQLKWLNVLKNNTTGTGKFPAMVNQPPAPLSNKGPAASPMPPYTGDGGGGGGGGWGGGGGGGSYDPVTKKWLANMASWRI